jgi:hypothetical protein
MTNPVLPVAAEGTSIAQRMALLSGGTENSLALAQQQVVSGNRLTAVVTKTIAAADGAMTDQALISVSAGSRIAVTAIKVLASSENSVAVDVRIGFGSANVPAASLTPVSGLLLDARAIPAGGGVAEGHGAGVIAMGGDGEDLRMTSEAPTAGHLTVTVSYYTLDV